MQSESRSLEAAADALARLDSLAASAPGAFGLALRSTALGSLETPPMKASTAVLAAAPSLDVTLPSELHRWRDFMDEEERRGRGGAPLTINRLVRGGLPEGAVSSANREALAAVLAPPNAGRPRPAALERAVTAAALIDDRRWADAVAALVLCAEGRMDRTWFLPFARVDGHERDAAIDAWRQGDPSTWTSRALESLATTARSHRARLERALEDLPAEEERVDELGRAAITARRALFVLRDSLVATVPSLADDLALSRPAAGDALERLVTAGLAAEITGRQRGRVFAYAAALVATA